MSDKIAFKTLVEEDATDSADSTSATKRPGTLSTGGGSDQPRPTLATGEVTPLREESKRQFLVTRAEGLRTIILLFVVISFGITVALAIEIVVGESQLPAHGGVASNNEICSDLGVMQLKKGGSAVDAAITAMLCNTIVQPQSGGLGGGGVMIIHDLIHNKTVVFDFREVAPWLLTADKVSSQPVTSFLRHGGLSVGVPGELKGMFEAHKMFGKLSWSNLFAPIIKLAEDGFKVNKKLAADILRRKEEAEDDLYSNFRQVFYKDSKESGRIPYEEGDLMVRKDLARVMRKISKEGPEGFYNGSLATEIVSAVRDAGGVMTTEDLNNYYVKRREPLVGSFNGYEVLTVPAPFSGSLLLYMLNDFETIKTESLSGEYFDDLAENLKKAFKCRDKLGDPMNFPEIIENEKRIANKTFINDAHFCTDTGNVPEDHGTAHVSVIDKDELLVSSTTSLNFWFGSLVVTNSGIVLNNEMADFSHPKEVESKFNQISPGKRPLSSMVPTIVHHNGKPCFKRISIGGINGTRITSSVAQTLINLLSFEMTAKDSVVSQKIYCTDTNCEIEGGFPNVNDVANTLAQKGSQIRITSKKLALVGVVAKKNADVESYADESLFAKGVAY